ncbi:MAG: FAD-binding protein, partial [Suipraeoptans sp.]
MSIILDKLYKVTDRNNVLINEEMKKHTTFKVGGPADYYIRPESSEEIAGIISVCKEEGIPYYIIGNGSNLLVADKGY